MPLAQNVIAGQVDGFSTQRRHVLLQALHARKEKVDDNDVHRPRLQAIMVPTTRAAAGKSPAWTRRLQRVERQPVERQRSPPPRPK